MKLSNATLSRLPAGISAPGYDRTALTPGIVHIGCGNFHRAHMAVYLDDLFALGEGHDWAILGAGVREGDHVIAVAGEGVLGLPELYRRVWTLGGPGAEIPLTVMRKGQRVEARIISADRADFLRKPKLH